MHYLKFLSLGLLAAALALGCSNQPTGGTKDAAKKDAAKKDGVRIDDNKEDSEHAHGKGPNGGVVFDLGRFHAEFTVDHDKKQCAILILGSDEKSAKAVAAKELTVTTKETSTKEGKKVAPLTIKLTPQDEKDGKASKFVGTDPGLGNVADFAGTVLGEINGKPSQGAFKE
ncbi:MAG: hypothetical protein U0840_08830 [Gemmataceae bacterium]